MTRDHWALLESDFCWVLFSYSSASSEFWKFIFDGVMNELPALVLCMDLSEVYAY